MVGGEVDVGVESEEGGGGPSVPRGSQSRPLERPLGEVGVEGADRPLGGDPAVVAADGESGDVRDADQLGLVDVEAPVVVAKWGERILGWGDRR